MLSKFLSFIKRPFIGDQNTGRYAFQQYQGYSYSGFVGNGGQLVKGTVNAINPATIVPGPSIKPLDASVTGNPASGMVVQPLVDDGRSF